jgi:hypothetical protein
MWIVILVTTIIILVGVGGGLAAKFLHNDRNSAQEAFATSKASGIDDSTVAAQSTRETVSTESFVIPISTTGGSTIYPAATTSGPIVLTSGNTAEPVTSATTTKAIMEIPPIQGNWRYCQKCHSMFFNGFADKGVCVEGGGHDASGYNFDLPHDVPPTATTQNQWRFCMKCFMMFFNGNTDKRTCAAGGGHDASGYNFDLPHDVPPTATTQDQWRYCAKCNALFFNSYTDKGSCAAGGGHIADGFNFVLPHDLYT